MVAIVVTGTMLANPAPLGAQESVRLVRVEGLAYDSLTKRPLPGAFISVEGLSRSATSDEKGRFRVDSIPAGLHIFSVQHAAFDSLGLSGTTARVIVHPRMPRVVLAVPSFQTMWRALCGDAAAPADSSLVYGSVRRPENGAVTAGALVEGSWLDLVGGGKSITAVGQRRWRRATVTDERGDYALCGVSSGTALTLRVAPDSTDTLSVTTVEVEATNARVIRRDVLLAAVTPIRSDATTPGAASDSLLANPSTTGVVIGTVTNADGVPIPNAIVAVDTLPEVRTNDDGRFMVRDVAVGTRQAWVGGIGLTLQQVTLEIRTGDTTRVVIPMKAVQLLGEVNVRADRSTIAGLRRSTFEDHRRMGLGYYRDSTTMGSQTSMMSVFQSIVGVTTRGVPGNLQISSLGCRRMGVFLDGKPIPPEELGLVFPKDLAALEVYPSRVIAPMDTPSGGGCSIILWTKAAFGR